MRLSITASLRAVGCVIRPQQCNSKLHQTRAADTLHWHKLLHERSAMLQSGLCQTARKTGPFCRDRLASLWNLDPAVAGAG